LPFMYVIQPGSVSGLLFINARARKGHTRLWCAALRVVLTISLMQWRCVESENVNSWSWSSGLVY